jgi:hypothetical protein
MLGSPRHRQHPAGWSNEGRYQNGHLRLGQSYALDCHPPVSRTL